jgi:hypothetical protein
MVTEMRGTCAMCPSYGELYTACVHIRGSFPGTPLFVEDPTCYECTGHILNELGGGIFGHESAEEMARHYNSNEHCGPGRNGMIVSLEFILREIQLLTGKKSAVGDG